LQDLAKQGGDTARRAKQMLKLVKEAERLVEKGNKN
jgi:hypothetical protein